MMADCLRFIISGDRDDEKAVQILNKAAKEAVNAEIHIEWFTLEDFTTDPSTYKQGAVVVCESFEGNTFETLKSHGCKIVGPSCVLSCLKNIQPLPSMLEPCLSVAMLDVVACCTNITSDHRKKLKDLISSMGGTMIGDFTQSVTHLIAGEVGSTKYQVACDLGKPIVQPSWVYDCWDQSKYKVIEGTESSFAKKHGCPCFKGLTICVTGLSADIRQEVKKQTEENGGQYSGELKMRTCTHLIVKLAKGEKYNYARQWKIHCVSLQWFYECVQSGHWIEEKNFEVMPGEESVMDESKIFDVAKTRVNMTIQGEMDGTAVSNKAAKIAEQSIRNREKAKSVEENIELRTSTKTHIKSVKISTYDMKKLNLSGIQLQSSMLLDGCKIFLAQMAADVTDQLRKLINAAGAMRFNQLNSNITHVIIGDIISKDIEEYIGSSLQKPFVVSPDWLIDSFKASTVLDENEYSLLDQDELEPAISKPFKVPEPKRPDVKKKKETATLSHLDDELEDDDVFIGQYLPQAESSRISFVIESKPALPCARAEDGRISDELQKSDSAEAVAGPVEELERSTLTGKEHSNVINKCKFFVKYFEVETMDQIKSLVQDFNGKIVNQDARSDYVIVPLTYEKKRRIGKKEVTICWLEQSLEKDQLLEVDSCFLFRPFHLPPDCLPLKDCVISVSQFTGIEREHVVQVADLMGAVMQDSFVRKAGNGLQANTHLLLAEASGAKYEAACEWGVHCVSKEWLFACAEEKRLVPVEDYPLDDHTKMDSHENEDEIEEVTVKDGDVTEAEDSKTGHQQPDRVKEMSACDGNKKDLMKPCSDALKEKDLPTSITPVAPGKPLLQVGKPFKPSFDLNDMMEYLKSPATCFTPRSKSRQSNGSFALDEFVGDQLRKALEITSGDTRKKSNKTAAKEEQENQSKTPSKDGNHVEKISDIKEEKKDAGVLQRVVIAVSKKLLERQGEIHNLAASLGAECQFGFDENCTHLIHKGKATDTLAEVKYARSLKREIVSEHWLDACLSENKRVDEKMYPCTYNPKMSLSVVTKGRRSTRSLKSTSAASKILSTNHEEANREASLSVTNNQLESPPPRLETPKRTHDDGPVASKGQSASLKKMVSPFEEKASSLDARLEFQRQMEELMEATKGNKGGLRRNRRQQLSSASPSEDLSLKRSSVAKRLRTRQSSQKSNSESSKSSGEKKQGTIEQSQGDVITYDDPAGRIERARILAQLKAASPSQDGFHSFKPIEVSDFPLDSALEEPRQNDDAALAGTPIKQEALSNKQLVINKQVFPSDFDHLTTPPKRPVNMHISKPVQLPQPVSLLEGDEIEEENKAPVKTYKFLLSAMTPQEKIHYSAMIEELSGMICDAQYFTLECTHVIVGNPSRNEKFLAAVAAGKWVLHKSFLEASREAGFFVNEEEHEWGSEAEPSKLTTAARRWRRKLEKERGRNQSAGAFSGWHVLLCVGSTVRQHGFKRMLEAGNGTVASIHPPFTALDGVTHAFIDPNKTKPGVIDYKMLHSAGIWVLRPDYIADYLTQEPAPPTMKYVLQEVLSLMEPDGSLVSANDSKKRKNIDERSSQKTKRTKN